MSRLFLLRSQAHLLLGTGAVARGNIPSAVPHLPQPGVVMLKGEVLLDFLPDQQDSWRRVALKHRAGINSLPLWPLGIPAPHEQWSGVVPPRMVPRSPTRAGPRGKPLLPEDPEFSEVVRRPTRLRGPGPSAVGGLEDLPTLSDGPSGLTVRKANPMHACGGSNMGPHCPAV